MDNKYRNKWYIHSFNFDSLVWVCCRSYNGFLAENIFTNPDVITDTTTNVIAIHDAKGKYTITQIYDNDKIYFIDSNNNKILRGGNKGI